MFKVYMYGSYNKKKPSYTKIEKRENHDEKRFTTQINM